MLTSRDVSIIIPNFNGSGLLRKHLAKVIPAAHDAEIIIVDDKSEDDSVGFIKKYYPGITLIEKKKNDGFSSTVNTGVARSKREVVYLLNSDVVPRTDFLKSLLPHFMDETVFAVGSLEESIEKNETILRGRGIAEWRNGLFIHRKGEVTGSTTAWVSGGSGAFRRSVWNKLGGLDTLFNPFYWEDIDLSYRALKAGYRLVFEPGSVVNHYHEAGAIKSHFTPSQVKQIAYRNQYIFIWKNLSESNIFLTHIVLTVKELTKAIVRGDMDMLIGYLRAILLMPRIITSRMKGGKFWKLKDSEVPLV